VPSLDLRFAESKSLIDAVTGASLVTFTRASSGTVTDSAGVLQTAATDVPRFDHNPTTGESLGLLVEEQRTNLALRSEEFDNASWAKPGGTTCSANAATAPDGNTTADKLVEFNGNVNQAFEQTIALVLGTAYSISVYVKAAERTQFRLAGRVSGNWSVFPSGRFDLSAGTVLNSSGDRTATISEVDNGWYRCTIYGTSAVGTSAGMIVSPLLTGGTTSSYAGDGTSGIFLWGAQLEAGAFPTSYIPTTTAAATRSADVASITGSAFSSWYSQSEGTVYSKSVTPSRGTYYTFDDGTSANQIAHYFSGLTTNKAFVGAVGVTSCDLSLVDTAAGVQADLAFAYRLNDFSGSGNGAAAVTDVTGNVPVVNNLKIGRNVANTAFMNGTIRRITYWPQRLANSTLQQITQ
jgi:hypothetical protein